MSDESVVIKPRVPFENDVILPENADELAKFMEEPTTAIAEALTGAMAAGPKAWMVMGGRIVQGVLKAKLFQQVSQEIKDLREKGRIPEDFADEKHRYGAKSWVELLMIIDEETPDPDRLDALKAMFYSVNKVNAEDGERIVAYQLFQIAKGLTSSQVLYIRAVYEIYKAGERKHHQVTPSHQWLAFVGQKLGHNVIGLLDRDDLALVNTGLLSPRMHADNSGINEANAHMTHLGILFCENIETYHIETGIPVP